MVAQRWQFPRRVRDLPIFWTHASLIFWKPKIIMICVSRVIWWMNAFQTNTFHLAMMLDINDLLNTTAPNRGYYALTLFKLAVHCATQNYDLGNGQETLISKDQFEVVANMLGNLMSPSDVEEAQTYASIL